MITMILAHCLCNCSVIMTICVAPCVLWILRSALTLRGWSPSQVLTTICVCVWQLFLVFIMVVFIIIGNFLPVITDNITGYSKFCNVTQPLHLFFKQRSYPLSLIVATHLPTLKGWNPEFGLFGQGVGSLNNRASQTVDELVKKFQADKFKMSKIKSARRLKFYQRTRITK